MSERNPQHLQRKLRVSPGKSPTTPEEIKSISGKSSTTPEEIKSISIEISNNSRGN